MRNIIRNKKGDIPITILVIGVLAVCGLVIFSFYSADKKFKDNFQVMDLVEVAVKEKEKISFYQELGFSEEEIRELVDIRTDRLGNHLYLEKNGIVVRYYLP